MGYEDGVTEQMPDHNLWRIVSARETSKINARRRSLHKGYYRFTEDSDHLNQVQCRPDKDDINLKFPKSTFPLRGHKVNGCMATDFNAAKGGAEYQKSALKPVDERQSSDLRRPKHQYINPQDFPPVSWDDQDVLPESMLKTPNSTAGSSRFYLYEENVKSPRNLSVIKEE
ncbi:hypothetical protein Tco_0079991 [Tanacetum coccineum]